MGGKIDIPIEVYQSLKNDIAKKDEIITAKAIDLVASSFSDRLFNWGSITKGIKKYDYGEGKG